MYKSQPQLMIRENAQLSAVKLAVCYRYKSNGIHIPAGMIPTNTDCLNIKLWGITKDGEELIASCPLETSADYIGKQYASSVITGIPEKDYPFMCYSYDTDESPDFDKMISISNLFVEVKPYPDILDDNVETNAVV